VREHIAQARDAGAELVALPELVLSGYPPEDLLLKEHFLQAAQETLEELARAHRRDRGVVGYPERADDVYNALAVLADGAVQAVYRKTRLPNYGVFDEQRYFQAGDGAGARLGSARLGLTICEDIWTPGTPAREEALAGRARRQRVRLARTTRARAAARAMLVQRARDNLCAVAFCNCVGGQDELVFDGTRSSSTTRARCSPARRSSPRRSRCAPSTCRAPRPRGCATRACARPSARALPDVRHWPLERSPAPAGRSARRRRRRAARARGRGVRRALPRRARLRAQERLRARRARLSGGIDSTLVVADRRRRARLRPRDRGGDAVALLLEGTQSDARALAAGLGVQCLDLPIAPRWRSTSRCWPRVSTGASRTSPRRTCRRGSAATC
jgi:NAD+ synthase (glutamine-hydrolysing)